MRQDPSEALGLFLEVWDVLHLGGPGGSWWAFIVF